MKVYLVTKQWFYLQDGTDYAMPIDLEEEIEVYTSKAKAVKKMESIKRWASEDIKDGISMEITAIENGFQEKVNSYLRRIVKVTTKTII